MGTQEFYSDISLENNMLKNARIDVLEALPAIDAAQKGRVVTVAGDFYVNNGTKWVKMADDELVQSLDTTVNATDTGLVDKVAAIEEAIGTEGGTGIGARVTALEGTVGDASKGLVKSVADNTTAIGTNTTNIATNKTTAEAAKAKADANESAISGLTTRMTAAEGDIDTLEGKVGASTDAADSTGSLYARTTKNANDITALTQTVADNKTAAETELAKKVDKVDGKQLSTEDFTTDFKTKLEGIETGAQVNKVTDVTVDNVSVLDGTVAKIDMSDYAKKADLTAFMIPRGSVATINDLPSDATAGDVYNVQTAFTNSVDGKVYPAGTNVCRVQKTDGTLVWDPLGGQFDFSQYYIKTEVDTALGKKQDNLTEAQLAAANSGITSTKVATYDGYSALITAAQDAADAAQETADKKVDALTVKPAAGTFTKVTINAEGQVTEGVAQTASDIPDLSASKITDGVFALDRIPIMAVQKTATLVAGSTVTVDSGMTTALVAQVINGNNKVVFCETTISGGSVVLGSSVAGAVKVNIIGLR